MEFDDDAYLYPAQRVAQLVNPIPLQTGQIVPTIPFQAGQYAQGMPLQTGQIVPTIPFQAGQYAQGMPLQTGQIVPRIPLQSRLGDWDDWEDSMKLRVGPYGQVGGSFAAMPGARLGAYGMDLDDDLDDFDWDDLDDLDDDDIEWLMYSPQGRAWLSSIGMPIPPFSVPQRG